MLGRHAGPLHLELEDLALEPEVQQNENKTVTDLNPIPGIIAAEDVASTVNKHSENEEKIDANDAIIITNVGESNKEQQETVCEKAASNGVLPSSISVLHKKGNGKLKNNTNSYGVRHVIHFYKIIV